MKQNSIKITHNRFCPILSGDADIIKKEKIKIETGFSLSWNDVLLLHVQSYEINASRQMCILKIDLVNTKNLNWDIYTGK